MNGGHRSSNRLKLSPTYIQWVSVTCTVTETKQRLAHLTLALCYVDEMSLH